ncbi:MAG TPA: methyltransferase [Polyangia bacterium]
MWQPREGYRFSIDPLLLLDFLRDSKVGRACDLGTGCGVLALGLLCADPDARVTAVELQPRLAELARKNAVENGLSDRAQVIELDLADRKAAKRALPGASFDLVVSNPPYRPLGEGGTNPDGEEAIARHELRLTLSAVCAEARRLLVPGGRAAIVYPAERLPSLLATLDGAGLRPFRLRLIHGKQKEPARRALVEARKGHRGHLTVEPSLVVHDDDGAYTADARRALGERL